jgi:hypothetical protein
MERVVLAGAASLFVSAAAAWVAGRARGRATIKVEEAIDTNADSERRPAVKRRNDDATDEESSKRTRLSESDSMSSKDEDEDEAEEADEADEAEEADEADEDDKSTPDDDDKPSSDSEQEPSNDRDEDDESDESDTKADTPSPSDSETAKAELKSADTREGAHVADVVGAEAKKITVMELDDSAPIVVATNVCKCGAETRVSVGQKLEAYECLKCSVTATSTTSIAATSGGASEICQRTWRSSEWGFNICKCGTKVYAVDPCLPFLGCAECVRVCLSDRGHGTPPPTPRAATSSTASAPLTDGSTVPASHLVGAVIAE